VYCSYNFLMSEWYVLASQFIDTTQITLFQEEVRHKILSEPDCGTVCWDLIQVLAILEIQR
jgi:hypothetical protein